MIIFTIGSICVLFWVMMMGIGFVLVGRWIWAFVWGLLTFRPAPWVFVLGSAALMASHQNETINAWNSVVAWYYH